MTSTVETFSGLGTSPEVLVDEPTTKPVKIWAAVGAVFLAIAAYLVIGWIFSDDFKRTPPGPTPVPTFMKVGLMTFTIGGAFVWLAFVYHFLIKPWKREGHLTTDGCFTLTFCLIWWQDPLSDWLGPAFTYNAWMPNRGSWLGMIPGWVMPNANLLAEPPLLTFPVYLWWVFGVVVFANWGMRRAKAKNPRISKLGLIGRCFAFMVVADIVLELIFLRTGYYTYSATIRELTLFPDEFYRFPVYEAVLWGSTWTAFACLRFFKNDKGQNLGERGIDEIRGSTKQKGWLRFLGIWGVVNVIFLGMYNIPAQFFLANADEFPEEIQSRSYFTNGLCGEGTEYACWGGGVPIPRPESGHVGPNGAYRPGEAEIKGSVPFRR